MKHCSVANPARVRTRTGERATKTMSIKYFITGRRASNKFLVCRSTFLKCLGVGKDRVEHIMKNYLEKGTLTTDRRGGDTKSKRFKDKVKSVLDFIRKLPCQDGHYCRLRSPHRQYLPSDLNIAKLWRMYNKSVTAKLKVKESYFRFLFKTKFNVGFGSPRTDACSTCLRLAEQIKTTKDLDEKKVLVSEKNSHVKEANRFYNFLREKKDDMITLSFDCEKNMPLPKVPDQSAYYSRQLYLYNFCIVKGTSHDSLNAQNTTCYVWLESEHAKGSNEIASALFHRLCKLDCTKIKTVRLISDGCVGQNKNSIVMGMVAHWLSKLSPKNVKKVEMIYPVTGHSYLPADRVFANIEKQIKKNDTIVQPQGYMKLMTNSTVLQVEKDWVVQDWKTEISDVMVRTDALPFMITECKRIILTRCKTEVIIRGETDYLVDGGTAKSCMKKGEDIRFIRPSRTDVGHRVKEEKLVDVKKLLTEHFGQNWHRKKSLQFYVKLLRKYKLF